MTTRKDFLLASAVATSLGGAMLTTSSEVVAQTNGIPDFSFDLNRFNQTIARAAKHHHMFAAATISNGNILSAMNNTLYAYNHSLNVPDSDVFEVGVLYHGAAICLAFNDSAWTQLFLPALPRVAPNVRADIQTLRLSSGNPLLHQSLEPLVSRGCLFFVCNNALNGMSMQIAQALNRSPADVYAQLSSNLVSGASLVPTGVWAVHALQEAHFTYLQTAL